MRVGVVSVDRDKYIYNYIIWHLYARILYVRREVLSAPAPSISVDGALESARFSGRVVVREIKSIKYPSRRRVLPVDLGRRARFGTPLRIIFK